MIAMGFHVTVKELGEKFFAFCLELSCIMGSIYFAYSVVVRCNGDKLNCIR